MSFKPGTKVRIRPDIASIQQGGYDHGYFITNYIQSMAGKVVTIQREAHYKGAYFIEEISGTGFGETWLQPVKLIKRRKQC